MARASSRRGSSLTFGKTMRALIVTVFLSASVFAAELVPDERTAIFPTEKARDFTEAVCLEVPPGITGFWTPALSDMRGIEIHCRGSSSNEEAIRGLLGNA